jgi:hypothetical protein
MKTGTLDKLKFDVLKKLLGLPKYQVMGILEGLWYMTATNAPDGAVGRYSNLEIAAWLEWAGDENHLVESMIKARFLDRCSTHRLVVHDWQDHCPLHVKANLSKHKKDFAQAESEEPPMGDSQGGSQGKLLDPVQEGPSYSIQTKPIQTKPRKTLADRKPADDPPGHVNGSRRFTPPQIPEIREYITQLADCSVDPIAFWNHYEAVGWRVGKSPMKDWRAAVRTWNLRDRERRQ